MLRERAVRRSVVQDRSGTEREAWKVWIQIQEVAQSAVDRPGKQVEGCQHRGVANRSGACRRTAQTVREGF